MGQSEEIAKNGQRHWKERPKKTQIVYSISPIIRRFMTNNAVVILSPSN